jgi:hypothetical protein
VKERPIIFGPESVRALLAGTKTMTRRVVSPEPCEREGFPGHWSIRRGKRTHVTNTQRHVTIDKRTGAVVSDREVLVPFHEWILAHCPHGKVGDRLWVRETWCRDAWGKVWHRASCEPGNTPTAGWSSPIHMPRAASRLTLEITSVRVEKLNEITEEDAVAEGCVASNLFSETWWQGYRRWDEDDPDSELHHTEATGDEPPDWMIEPKRMKPRPDLDTTARQWFAIGWNRLNASRGYSFESNPFVWVIGLRRLEPAEAAA